MGTTLFKTPELPLNARTALRPFFEAFFTLEADFLMKNSVWKQTSKPILLQ